jgi:putative ABC transport system permease protein
MLLNYLKITIRNVVRNKTYSFINIAGLAIGIACCILILLFINDELNYDKFHKNYENIYRACLDSRIGNSELNAAVSPAPMAEALVKDFPQVLAATKFTGFGSTALRYNDIVYNEENYFWTDSTIFDVLTFEFVKGDAKNALNQPNTVVITEKMAEKYFGDEEPIGKLINSDNEVDILVTGVVKEFPANSHFHFDFLSSFVGQIEDNQFWFRNSFYTYFVLQDGIDPGDFESLMNNKFVEYTSPEIVQATGISMEDNIKQGFRYQFLIQSLTDIHLKSDFDYELEPNSDINYVYYFSIIALGILLIAIVNFMNLSTAKSSGRAKEVGIRKTLGSPFTQLVKQFLSESVLMSFIAVVLAVVFVYLMLPYFNSIAQKDLSFDLFTNPVVLLFLILLSVFIGILAGSYPAFFLASFNPVTVLSGKHKRGPKGSLLRSGLVIFQFSISIILILGTIIIYNQLQYIQSKNLGFNKEQVLIIHEADNIGTRVFSFIDELETNPDVTIASNSGNVMGSSFSSYTFRMADQPEQAALLIWTLFTDVDFAKTYQFKFKEGRYYSEDRVTDSTGIVVNEAAVKVLGIQGDPIGKEIIWIGGDYDGQVARIIGVIEDFHFESFHTEIGPFVMNLWRAGDFGRYVSVRIAANNIPSTIEFIKEKWIKYAGQQAFEYTFLDEDFAKIHAGEQRTGKLFTTFSILAIFVACLGLFGLTAFAVERRIKEIGIRKVLGATVSGIVFLFSKDFLKLIVISNVVAWPLAYFFMNNWLEDFAYRIDISWWVFVLSGGIALLIALITISLQAIKAATANPVDSLKYE